MLLTWIIIIKLIHVISAAIWIGGIIFTTFMSRGLRREMPQREVTALVQKVGRIIASPMRISLYIAIGTGPFLLLSRGINPITLLLEVDTFVEALAASKTILAAIIVVLAIYHTRIGSRLSGLEDEKEYSRTRMKLIVVGWLSLILTLALPALGTIMRYS